MKSAESYRNSSNTIETCMSKCGVTYRSGVYKISMVSMRHMSLTKKRTKGSIDGLLERGKLPEKMVVSEDE